MEEKRLINSYRNGNSTVFIYDDGTRRRETDGDEFIPSFADNIYIKITEKGDGKSGFFETKEDGESAKLMAGIYPLEAFIEKLRPRTELNIEDELVLYPDILELLVYLRKRSVTAHITVSQEGFLRNYHRLMGWSERHLINDINIIVSDTEDELFLEKVRHFTNIVLCVVNGVFDGTDLDNLVDKKLKLKILGYQDQYKTIKDFGENVDQEIQWNKDWLKNNLTDELLGRFKTVLFDSSAAEQLDIKNTLALEEGKWQEFYIPSSNRFSFYIDAVNRVFSKNKFSKNKHSMEDTWTADKMFRELRKSE